MTYLTLDEYIELGYDKIDEDEFVKLEKFASGVLNHVTRNFYELNSLDDDIKFRRNKFKQAVAAQIEYFNDMGATSFHGLKEFGTVSIGRTTLSKGSRNSSVSEDESDSIVSSDVYMHLSGTGILYSKIGVIS